MKKVIVVFGTRPEAIKMCPVIHELKKSEALDTVVCLTGQHREMLKQAVDIFNVVPDYNLDIMHRNQSLAQITSRVIQLFDEVLCKENPDLVLVHGDTTTSFAAAVASYYRQIPVGHVEAGLRTYNMNSPFPEEFNRQSVDLISDLYFAPTETARNQLIKENKDNKKIVVTGNTVIDALKTTIIKEYHHDLLDWVGKDRLILLTAHRRENLGEPMRRIFKAIRRIVEDFEDVKVIYPVHFNPRVREVVNEVFENVDRIRLIEPLDVYDFHNFMSKSYLIMTDSGGIQEEAPSLGVPVLVLRDTTERPEGVAAGTLMLVGTEEERIYKEAKGLLENSELYDCMRKANNPYGDGKASQRIVNAILDYLA